MPALDPSADILTPADRPFRCCRAGDPHPLTEDRLSQIRDADGRDTHPMNADAHFNKPAPQDWYRDVLAFHEKFCPHLIGERPGVPTFGALDLRMSLIQEEFDELGNAAAKGDIPGVADACADLIYVVAGMAVTYGIDLRPIWAAVQAANMAKEGGGSRSDGKILKPPGWQAPDIEGVLREQGWGG